MREFPVIDSTTSLEQLRMRLKENELEQYGEPFTPDFVYDVIRRLPRFSTMRVSTTGLFVRGRTWLNFISGDINRMLRNFLAFFWKVSTTSVFR